MELTLPEPWTFKIDPAKVSMGAITISSARFVITISDGKNLFRVYQRLGVWSDYGAYHQRVRRQLRKLMTRNKAKRNR